MKVKKNNLYALGTILIVVIGTAFLFLNSGRALPNADEGDNEVQVVKLSVNGGNYVLEPSELKKDVRVRLEADMSRMPGCSRTVVIPAFGISKTFTSSSSFVEFVADKSGTFNIACSMNMYRGTFVVLESDGFKSDYVEEKLSTSGGCGGCGGI